MRQMRIFLRHFKCLILRSWGGLDFLGDLRHPFGKMKTAIPAGRPFENKVNIRQYAKYLLKEGSVSDKRELLANLRSRIIYKNKKLTLVQE